MAKKPKAPKRPKKTATLKQWENYDKKMKEHHAKVNGIGAAHKKKESLIKKYC